MIYGLYLSATGVMTNSHNQDVIANNLANAETTGFKRSLAQFQTRQMEAQTRHSMGEQNPVYDKIGGGQWLQPTVVDLSQGSLENSSNPFDTAIFGNGYLAVQDPAGTRLTRDGQMLIDRAGDLVLANSAGNKVLDHNQQPINLKGYEGGPLTVASDGSIQFKGKSIAQIGLFDVEDPKMLRPVGDNLIAVADNSPLKPATGVLQSGYTERSNVDPTLELTRLMEAQRLLEANVNMIKYQDQTLGKCVNEVGKIG